VAFLSILDERIDRQQSLVDSLKKYKRGVSNALFVEADDWEQTPFLEIFSTVSDKPYQVTTSEYYDSGLYEVVDQGKSDIVGYNSNASKVFDSVPIIVYGDHTTIIKYRKTPFIVGGDGVKLLTTHTQNDLLYLYYALCQYNIQPEGYKRHFSIVKNLFIPLPSVEQQHIIAKTLAIIDLKINKESDVLEQLLMQKKALLQQLFI
jgi:type I restriction enzyme S subunit